MRLTGVGRDELLVMIEQLQAQVTDLQRHSTETLEATLARRVRAFHERFGHPVEHTPRVPSEEQVRFRLRLIAEEFFELLRSALDVDGDQYFDAYEEGVRGAINGRYPYQLSPVKVDLVELADALADLSYVIEGTAATCGIDMRPIVAEVYASNMAKDPNGPDGKPTKPEGWSPPDIRRVLIEQGWTP